MDDTPLRLIDDLLDRASKLEEPKRSSFLDRECGDDVALRQELEDLLAIDTSALEEIDRPVFELIPTDINAQPSTLGPFHLEEELGRGGTAVVYRARRQDGVDNRPVAIKLLHSGAPQEERLERLQREGDILSSLQHPNIARVFGGGVAPDGRPYLVMELVEGEPIARYCDRMRLSLRERMQLLIPLLSAIQYAHSKLVVHCDLKPDNVLVTSSGEIRVLDFGVAKLLRQPGPDPSTVTQYGLRMLTPEYAAPEQLSMAPVSVAADIYSLGVMLYELLTGKRPFERVTSPSSFLQKVLSQPPLPPSSTFHHGRSTDRVERAERRRTSPKNLQQLLKDDLDGVVIKALSKTPMERYVSVLELQQDLIDFLENRPVRAARGRFGYRTAKFLRRRRREALAAGLVLLAATGWTLDREQSRQEIVAERNRARVTANLMKVFLTNADPYNRAAGVESTVASIMEHSRKQVDLSLVPEVESSLLKTLARIHGNDGDFERSSKLYKQAVELLEDLPSVEPELLRSARVGLADSLLFDNRPHKAAEILQDVVETLPPGDSYARAATWTSLARALLLSNQVTEAKKATTEAVAMTQRLPQDLAVRSLALELLLQRSEEHKRAGDLPQSEEALRKAAAGAYKEWGEGDIRNQYFKRDLAEVMFLQGRLQEALELAKQVASQTVDIQGPRHLDSAKAQLILGRILHAADQTDDAIAALRQAVDVLTATIGVEDPLTYEAQQFLRKIELTPESLRQQPS